MEKLWNGMKTFKRICVMDYKITAENGDCFKVEKGKEYTMSAVNEMGYVLVMSNFWVTMPEEYFASELGVQDGNFVNPESEVPSGSLCEICNFLIDDLAGDPLLWGVGLPYKNGNGKLKYYHRSCVASVIERYFD